MKNICKVKKYIDDNIVQGLSSTVYRTEDDKIIKEVVRSRINEKKYNTILKTLKKKDLIFFNPPILFKDCGKYTYYLFNKVEGDLITILSKKNIDYKNILLQLISGLYILNHKLGFFHNDLIFLRNIMFNYNKENITFNGIVKFNIGKILIKFIDFGVANEDLRIKKYIGFIKFFNIKNQSEILYLCYAFFNYINFLKTGEKYNKKLDSKIIKFANNIENISGDNLKKFDTELIKYFYKSDIQEFLN